jgi:hypothetical protein
MLNTLKALPRRRGVHFRPDRKKIAWERMGNRKAILGYTRGQEAAQPVILAGGRLGHLQCALLYGSLFPGPVPTLAVEAADTVFVSIS